MLNQDVFLVGCIVSAIIFGVVLNHALKEKSYSPAILIFFTLLAVIGGAFLFELIVTYRLIQ